MEDGWVCLNVDFSLTRSDFAEERVAEEIERIFRADLVDILAIGGDLVGGSDELQISHYVFVKCVNYSSHIDELRNSAMVTGVLDDYGSPRFVPEEEMDQLREGMRCSESGMLFPGDIVDIRGGYWRGLSGVILSRMNGKYNVMFKLCTTSTTEVLDRKSLTHRGNLFDMMKIPVTIGKRKAKKLLGSPGGGSRREPFEDMLRRPGRKRATKRRQKAKKVKVAAVHS